MPSSSGFEQERLELSSLLASGLFNRAPNLASLLDYVCAKYFEGGAEQIKEYNIAVEALGRPPEFDQRADSIVRVEVHRLRKRLRDYYEGERAAHAVHIEVPPGQYAPVFVYREPAGAALSAVQPPSMETTRGTVADLSYGLETATAKPAPPAWKRPRTWAVTLAILGSVLLVALTLWSRASSSHLAAMSRETPMPAQFADSIRILCGLERGSYIDPYGNTWSGDAYFQGGAAMDTINHPINGTRDSRLYNTRRQGVFRYDIPLKRGVYELRLHFAETVYGDNNVAGGGESSRVFSVLMNGRELLHDFDIVADAGASTADIKVFKDVSPAEDGKLHLQFEAGSNQPILSGIEITPGIPGRMRPIRMVAQVHPYTDKDGRYWEADRYASGGQLVVRSEIVSQTPDSGLYRGERFGNISYIIPVADGRYRITLDFVETWFGPGMAGGGPGPGKRVFDILCNGRAVRRNFDIFEEAGGADRAVTFTIPDVVPNHQGKLAVTLVPVNNYAAVSAVEVEDESR